jgi:hypothetical protein
MFAKMSPVFFSITPIFSFRFSIISSYRWQLEGYTGHLCSTWLRAAMFGWNGQNNPKEFRSTYKTRSL